MTEALEKGRRDRPRFIVAIGASAGGLEPILAFFSLIPPNTEMAFVVIQHLSPDHQSLMDEILSSRTKMPISAATNEGAIRPGHVYLIPPGHEILVKGGKFQVSKVDHSGLNFPISKFLSSLAKESPKRAIAIIMSGSGSDGVEGVRTLHAAGGKVLVQEPKSAMFDSMPAGAVATGSVDRITHIKGLAEAVMEIARTGHLRPLEVEKTEDMPVPSGQEIHAIFRKLQRAFDIDFSLYKVATIHRRIERRMGLKNLSTLEQYLAFIEESPHELEELYHDLLIGVTEFFRDKEAFSYLETSVIPEIIRSRRNSDEIRVWVAGCATGEEAYSIAILIQEILEKTGSDLDFKIYATDVHRGSLMAAGMGLFGHDSVSNLSPERLRRFFSKKEDGYVVVPQLRRKVIFAPHNLISDPPFTRMDMITCRNLLIYIEPDPQKRILGLMHFALKPRGFLFLGPSESLGDLEDEFDCTNRTWKVYRKRDGSRISVDFRLRDQYTARGQLPDAVERSVYPTGASVNSTQMTRVYDAIVEKFVPPAVLIDSRNMIVHTFGDCGRFMRISGRFSGDILSNMSAPLRTALSAALAKAKRLKESVLFGNVEAESAGSPMVLDLSVEPLRDQGGPLDMYLISFRERVQEVSSKVSLQAEEFKLDELTRQRVADLEIELNVTKQNLQSTVEEFETVNEELQSSNEELMSSNEELQSTNQELHSLNEELHTVNAEYQEKILELTELNNDMDNIFRSTQVGTVFLDTSLIVRRFSPALNDIFTILPRDIGRPISHLSSNIVDVNITEELRRILATGGSIEREVLHKNGSVLLFRAAPYRTEQNPVAGIVLTFTDISQLKEFERLFRTAFDSAPNGMIMADPDGRLLLVNKEVLKIFGYGPEDLVGQTVDILLPVAKRSLHAKYRTEFMSAPTTRAMGKGRILFGQRKDGTTVQVEVGLNPVSYKGGTAIISSIIEVK